MGHDQKILRFRRRNDSKKTGSRESLTTKKQGGDPCRPTISFFYYYSQLENMYEDDMMPILFSEIPYYSSVVKMSTVFWDRGWDTATSV
jgi:hypothetical protein